jgi:hypothetical protein
MFAHKRDTGLQLRNVRFGYAGAMYALPPKADMCGATRDVRFVPKADKSKPPTDTPYFAGGIAHVDTSGNSCCQRVIRPAIAAPRTGASQNSQSWAM